MGHRTTCNCLLWKRRKDEGGLQRATLRRAPEVIQRRTCSIVRGHGARRSIDAVKGHHKRGSMCGCLLLMFILFWFGCMLMFRYVDV